MDVVGRDDGKDEGNEGKPVVKEDGKGSYLL